MCRDDPQGVHLLPISHPSNTVNHPFLDASDLIIIWGVGCSMHRLTLGIFAIHQINSLTDVG